MYQLTLGSIRRANLLRLPLFKNKKGGPAHSQPDGSDWSDAQWFEALAGEVGEYANLHKKFIRGDIDRAEFQEKAEDELADILCYLDLLAFRLGIDLGEAYVVKFNHVSRRVGANVFFGGSTTGQYLPMNQGEAL